MTATDQTSDPTIDTCNSLLRDEISAIETYGQAIAKFPDYRGGCSLDRIRSNHEDSARELSRLVSRAGADPATGSGLWGGFNQALKGTATLFGNSPALKVLQRGEVHSINDCENALANPDVSEEAKDLIRLKLLPSLSDHLIELQNRRNRIA